MQYPKVVLDTNILVSAFLFKGRAAEVVEFCIEYTENYTSQWLITEFQKTLSLKFKIENEAIDEIINLLCNKAGFAIIEPHSVLPDVCRDKDDNNVLQLVESVDANYLITGDKDLLVVDNFKSGKIISPGAFLGQIISK